MPRIGEPGTVTREQRERLEALGFEPSPHWSREEARLILDAVSYLREVIRSVQGAGEPPLDLQNRLLVLILSDTGLREQVRVWGGDGPPPRNAQFDRIAAFLEATPR